MRPTINVSYPGGAGHVLSIAGADAALRTMASVARISCVSAGACVGVASAFGVLPARLRGVLLEVMSDDRLLDFSPFALLNGGLCEWNAIGDVVDDMIGKGRTMGESLVPLIIVVTDLDTGLPVYLDSQHAEHRGILVREAVERSTALPGIAKARTIPSWMLGLYTPSIKLYGDGGASDNTADACFDAQSEPRVALRLAQEGGVGRRVHKYEPVAQLLGSFRALTRATGAIKSKRLDGLVVDLPALGNGFDFSVSRELAETRWQSGYDAVRDRATEIRTLGAS